MCTLIVFPKVSDKYPLVIAANRDEVPARPSENPRYLNDEVFAPRDLKRGGTWIGFSRRGLAVAITNRDADAGRKGRRSRGLLVTDCLNARSLSDAFRTAISVRPEEYSGFHLLIADASHSVIIVNDGERMSGSVLQDGETHVITSFGTKPGHHARDAMIRMNCTPDVADDPDMLGRLLSFHGPGPEDGTCAHGEGVIMESVFSTTARLSFDGKIWDVRWRSGRPCSDPKWSRHLTSNY